MRYYFEIDQLESGRWGVRSTAQSRSSTCSYETKIIAIIAAERKCKLYWKIQATPCGVRLRSEGDVWDDLMLFGNPRGTM